LLMKGCEVFREGEWRLSEWFCFNGGLSSFGALWLLCGELVNCL